MKHVYQIKVVGEDILSSTVISRFSKEVYREPPLEEDIQKFSSKCCSAKHYNLPMEISTIHIHIIKLNLIE